MLVLAALAVLGSTGCVNIHLPFFRERGSAIAGIVEAPDVAHYHFFTGREDLRQGEFKNALEHFRRAARLQPDFYEARLGEGHALMELRRYRAARRAYEAARRLRDTPEVRLYQARAALFEGRLDEASELAESARRGHPQPAQVLETLGAIAYRRGRLDEAGRLWGEALKLDPSRESLNALKRDLDQYLLSYPRSDASPQSDAAP
ncbi:MAG: hypothetical protein Kow0059_14090 [Candidatus Sumerlaeia bacterium]